MTKKVKYRAEVMSINVEASPNYEKNGYCNYKVGDIAEITEVHWDSPITMSGQIAERKADGMTNFYSFLSDSYHLNGGSWKLIPYEVED